MRDIAMRRGPAGFAAIAAVVALGLSTDLLAQGRGGQQQPPQTARAAAPIDLTGTWVSLVTDDWRWRMVTPPKGDVLYLPVNAEGRRVAETWDPARDEAANEQCKAYGAPGLMIMPGRFRFSWQDDSTLKLETDTGQQTRTFSFAAGGARPAAAPSLQGHSAAQWELAGGRRGRGPQRTGSLTVVTTNLKPGYFRKNGVPYGANAVLTEYYVLLSEPDGTDYLALTIVLEDPQYLTGPYIRTVQFKREADNSKWAPEPCSAR
jgi:hypothetical protein